MEFFYQKVDLFWERLLLGIESGEVRRLVDLLGRGKHGPFAPQLVEAFSSVFLLHILVISGSQVSGLLMPVSRFLSLFQYWVSLRWLRVLDVVFTSFLGVLFLGWVGATAPLTRAVLFGVALRILGPQRSPQALMLSLGVHGALMDWGSHMQRSFYLSWLAFLFVWIWGRIRLSHHFSLARSDFGRSLCVSLSMLVVVLSLGMEVPDLRWAWVWLPFSVLFLWMFDLLALPLMGWSIFFTLAAVLLGFETIPNWLVELWAYSCEALFAGLLGLLKGFCYRFY